MRDFLMIFLSSLKNCGGLYSLKEGFANGCMLAVAPREYEEEPRC